MDKLFKNFLCTLEGAKTKCKNLHWSAESDSLHQKLDEFGKILNDYQDGLAEEVMGIEGQVEPNFLVGKYENVENAIELAESLLDKIEMFYSKIPEEYVGVKGETDAFIHKVNKYKFLFSICK